MKRIKRILAKRKRARRGGRRVHETHRSHLFRSLRLEPLEDRRLLAQFTVSNLDEIGVGSLRQAIIDANAAAAQPDEIVFQAGLTGTINLTSGQIDITDALTINGPGAANLTIDAQQNSRIFDSSGGNFDVAINDLTLTGGQAPAGEDGGAIRFGFFGSDNTGTLNVASSTISGNSAGDDGGGIFTSSGSVSVTSSTISGNSAGGDGGGIYTFYGSVSVTGSTISGNSAGRAGGGIYTYNGSVSVTGSTISGNSAGGAGGGIRTYSGPVSVTGSTISGNSADAYGGGIYSNSGSVNVNRSTISGNSARDNGGGIQTVSGAAIVTSSTISGNSAGRAGGGIRTSSGSVSVTGSTISGNSADGGGGIAAFNFFAGFYHPLVSITSSTISGNSAVNDGGGIYTYGSSVSVTSSTISGNSVGDDGGGIFISNVLVFNRSLTVASSIIAGNFADGSAADFVRDPSDSLSVTNSLIGDNTSTGLTAASLGSPDANGNLIGTSGSPIDPMLGPLAGNGGPTQTHALLPGSPAIDAGGGGVVIFSTDFAGRTVTGNTASNITYTLNGVADPGDLTAVEGNEEVPVRLTGLFDTVDASSHFAPDLNTDNEDNWILSVPLALTVSSLTIDEVVLDGDHFGNAGTFQVDNRDTDFRVSLTGSISGQVATETKTTGLVTTDWTLAFFDNTNPIPLSDAESWTLTIETTNFPNNSGNNTALDGFAINGSVGTDQRGFGRTFDFPGIANVGDGTDMGAFEVGLVVTTADDELDGDISDPSDLSLREAINFANNNAGGFDITFDPSLAGVPINLTLGQLSISDELAIRGLGAGDTTIDAGGNSRIFDASGGNFDVTINGVTLTGGQTPAGEDGGAIRFGFFGSDNTGTLSVTGSTISGNSASAYGGGIYSNSGSVNVNRSTISGNSARDGAGMFGRVAQVDIKSSTVSGNAATDNGGGINTYSGPIIVKESTISGNSARDGGGIFPFSGSVAVTNSTVSGNSARDSGGGIRAFYGSVQVTSSTITGNSAGEFGGGIHALDIAYTANLTLAGTIIAGNVATSGDPDFRWDGAVEKLSVTNSLVGDNSGTLLAAAPVGSFNANRNLVGTSAAPIDPMLGPLGNNGGPTQTHALLPGSPAIGLGSDEIALYRLEETSTSNPALDSAGADHNGTYMNGVTLGQASANGLLVNAASFDGVDDFVEIPRMIAGDFTISMWVKTSQTAQGTVWWQGYGLVDGEVGDPVDDFGTSVADGKFAFGVGATPASGGDVTILSTTSINDGGWHHVAATRDATSGEMKVYVDGVNEKTQAGPTGFKTAPPMLNIGRIRTGSPTRHFRGLLDEVAIADRVLSTDQIKAQFDAGVAIPTSDQRGAPRPIHAVADTGAFELQTDHVFVVNSTGDASDAIAGDGMCETAMPAECTLRAAIEEANAFANADPNAPDMIFFDIAGGGPHVIQPMSPLPSLRDAVVIDGTSEPNFDPANGNPVVEIDGTNAGAGASGFTVSGAGGGSVIRGLAINRFDAHGVFISRLDNVTVEHNFIGTDTSGSIDRGNGEAGVYIINAENNVVRQNVISGNDLGVKIEGPQSTNNTLIGNFIGTDAAGTAELKNRLTGVEIAGSPGNTIGGTALADRNVIGGGREGVAIRGGAATSNTVLGNFIGTDATGGSAIRITRGVHIVDGDNNTVGGAGGAANLISGNTKGVEINRGENNLVHGNFIGTDLAGDDALANVRGLLLRNAVGNRIGNEPNVISGNTREGVKIFGGGSTGNVVRDNRIGTNAAGDAAIPNREGVIITSNAEGNTIGGTTPAERNVISGNTVAGVFLLADNNTVTGNLIGTNLAGTAAIPNDTGVFVRNSSGNAIGGSVSGGESNLISGNAEQGVLVTGNNAANITIAGNAIGTNLAGTAAVANKHGVRIENGAHTIGGATPDDGNVISGNSQNGVYIIGAGADGNLLQSNRIGTSIDGSGPVPNDRSGVLIEDAPGNFVGSAAAGNSIAGNTQTGVKIRGIGATGNTVQNNAIGLDGLTMMPVPNGDGIRISDDASDNIIGGMADSTDNEIANNTGRGVWISGGTNNAVSRNSIHDNGALGISIGALSATPNDPDTGSGADADTGANNLQNTPDLTTVALSAGNLSINYSMSSAAANSAYPITVEFFLADAGGEGGTFLGTDNIGSPSAKTANIPAGPAALGSPIVATATDNNGNTSEFSAAANAAAPLMAAESRESRDGSQALNARQLSQVAGIAIARLSDLGLSADLFSNVSYAIADLPGATLGLAVGNQITIDTNAAGLGWAVNPKSQIRNPQSIDLLNAVMHELGHAAGLPDLYDADAEDDLMYAWLEAGVRKRSLEASLADEAFAQF
jgi:CSLREA domain-containing protein